MCDSGGDGGISPSEQMHRLYPKLTSTWAAQLFSDRILLCYIRCKRMPSRMLTAANSRMASGGKRRAKAARRAAAKGAIPNVALTRTGRVASWRAVIVRLARITAACSAVRTCNPPSSVAIDIIVAYYRVGVEELTQSARLRQGRR